MIIFTEIGLKNWKNFGSVNISLSDRMFAVGANASGKSNFLDSFRFLKDVSTNGLQKAVRARGGIKKIRNLNARTPNYIEIAAKLSECTDEHEILWEYTLQFNAAGGSSEKRDINVSLEKIVKDGSTIKERRYNDSEEDYLSKQFTLLEQPAINAPFRSIYECFKNISYVNIIPQLIRETDSFLPSHATEDFYGRNLLETISATSEKVRNTRLRAINRVLKMTVPQFSDGTLRLFGIIWAILDGDGLMLLEEPELYLHSEIVKQLPMFIANAQKLKNGGKRQVIISSHSYDLLNTDTIAPEEILLLKQEKENTIIELSNTVEAVKQKIDAGYTPADAVIPQVAPKGILEGQLSLFTLN